MNLTIAHYAGWQALDVPDALLHAQDSGLTLNRYADPDRDGATDITLEDAVETAAVDPDLVYLTGRDTQCGVEATDLDSLAAWEMEPPVLLDHPTGWVVSYPAEIEDAEWGVTRDAFDVTDDGVPVWQLCRRDGSVDDGWAPAPLTATLDEMERRL